MPSSTISVDSTAVQLAAGAGSAGDAREITVRVDGAVSIQVGDAASQDLTMAQGDVRTFHRRAGQDLWAVSTGAATDVEVVTTP